MADDRAFRRSWTPKFSIVHPSARPHEWKATRDRWMRAMSKIGEAEYVICFDFGTCDITPKEAAPARLVWNTGRQCSTDATNHAAQCAVGRCLVVISDDVLPCENWDVELGKIGALWGDKECVIRVRTAGTADARGLLAVQILNRRRYERLGYLFHPSYVSMFGDDEFSLHAERDGVIVDAPHILMRHLHWTTGEREMDEVYFRQNHRERYHYGRRLLDWRMANGFPRETSAEFWKERRSVA